MKKALFAVGLATVMLMGITYAYAHGPGFGPGPRGMQWGYQGDVSNLTPEQTTKFRELYRKFNEETAQIRGAIVTKRLELQSLWADPKADPKAISDKERELRGLQDQMRDKMVQYRLEVRKSLTPEQLTEFEGGRGMGPGFGRGYGMGYGHGYGHGWGHGPGMGPGACY
jgi:Spy/CpxP family protein refolding chaperone